MVFTQLIDRIKHVKHTVRYMDFTHRDRRVLVARSQRIGRSGLRRAAWIILVCLSFTGIAIEEGRHPVEIASRLLPRTEREFQRYFLVDWAHALKKAKERPKYHVGDFNVQVFVISLDRMHERKLETVHSLEMQGVKWTNHNAVDGLHDLDPVSVKKYAGYKKQKRLSVTNGIGLAKRISLKQQHDNYDNLPTSLRLSLHERLRFGCYMSHVSLWQRIVHLDAPFAVVLEDDAVIAGNFSDELKTRIERLPDNWDILFLNGCYKKLGYVFASGLRQSRGGLCTFAYVISLRGARYLLQGAVLRREKPIDHVLDYETLTGRLLAFHADPPLARTSSNKLSTLAY